MERTDSEVLQSLLDEICRQGRESYENLDMDEFMAVSPWGRRQTERRFREQFLTSPVRFFRDRQAETASKLLRNGEDVLSASNASGFASPGRLHDAILARYGLTPGELRRKGEGVHIDFGFFETQLGIFMIAATARGVCWIALCGSNTSREIILERVEELEQAYQNADIEENPEKLQVYGDMLVAFLEHRVDTFDPPVEVIRGTTFQREVWAELRKIEPGETISYTELAHRVGRPRAIRAVANACGSNPVAIAIPCHRVIRSDGSLAGYAWGVEWKEKLLSLEAKLAAHAS